MNAKTPTNKKTFNDLSNDLIKTVAIQNIKIFLFAFACGVVSGLLLSLWWQIAQRVN